MRSISADVLAAQGATTRAALLALGHPYRAIRAEVASGALQAIGRSWVIIPDANPAIGAALRSGGVLGGASALRSYGVWVTELPPVQIATRPHSSPRRVPEGERIRGDFTVDEKPWRVSLVDALAQHARRVERDDAIASIDSALHQGLLDEEGLDRLFGLLPLRCRPWRRELDASAESGLESLLRVPCRDRGWRVETQAPAPGGGRGDLLIDGWLWVETDGDEWQDNEKQAAKDRKRGTAITAAGGRWLRFGYADVVHERPRTMSVIELVMAQGRPAPVRLAG
ncbi:hypothetical protein [Agrococcus sp. TSP3-2-1]|uniref:hypothetical protein n=1 Tax=Agrococcus sp. TSP3-2-1 TaxID=2804583 RepID=UPI003CF49EB4